MPRSLRLTALAAVAGVLLLALAVVSVAVPAHALPGFLPGHAGAGDAEAAHPHAKHGMAAFLLAVLAFGVAWLSTGPKSGAPGRRPPASAAPPSGAAAAGGGAEEVPAAPPDDRHPLNDGERRS